MKQQYEPMVKNMDLYCPTCGQAQIDKKYDIDLSPGYHFYTPAEKIFLDEAEKGGKIFAAVCEIFGLPENRVDAVSFHPPIIEYFLNEDLLDK